MIVFLMPLWLLVQRNSWKYLLSGQAKDDDKLNEITAISDLLDLLEIEGSTITIEEIVNKNVIMYCQLKIVKKN